MGKFDLGLATATGGTTASIGARSYPIGGTGARLEGESALAAALTTGMGHADPPHRFRGLPVTTVLGFTVPVATTRGSKLVGLAMLSAEEAGEGLLIPRCRSVHTFGMRFDLDLLFLDVVGAVVELRRSVSPRRCARCPEAEAVLELPSP